MFSTKVLYCTVVIISYPSALVDRGLRLRIECERIEKEERWVVCVIVRRVFHEGIIQLSPPDFPLIFHGENSQIRFGKNFGKLSTVLKIFNNLLLFFSIWALQNRVLNSTRVQLTRILSELSMWHCWLWIYVIKKKRMWYPILVKLSISL